MRKLHLTLICLLLALLTVSAVAAEGSIRTLVLVGRGIAVSTSDSTNFFGVKVAVGAVGVEGSEKRLGLVQLDGEHFKLTSIERDTGTVKGILVDKSSAEVGSMSVSSTMRGDNEVWVGTLTFKDESYNIYILQNERKANSDELRDRVKEFCTEHPEEERCKEKPADLCASNPDDEKCQHIFRRFCFNNADDIRCKEALTKWCAAHDKEEDCQVFAGRRVFNYCNEHPRAQMCQKDLDRIGHYCSKDRDVERCKEWCAKNPGKCEAMKFVVGERIEARKDAMMEKREAMEKESEETDEEADDDSRTGATA